MAAAATPQAEAFARLAVEETGYGVVADKIQKNLFASQKVYEFIRPMKTVGVDRAARGSQGHRDRRAVRRRRRGRAVDQPDLDRDLQDPDRASRRAARSCSARIPSAVKCITRVAEVMDEAARARRRARRRDQLDDDGHARGHAGADEAARRRRDPGDRRHGTGARRLQRRQAGLRRRARATRRRSSSAPPTSRKAVHDIITGKTFDNGVLCSSRELGRRRRADRRGGEARVPGAGRLLPVDGRRSTRSRKRAGDAAAAAEPGAGRQVGDVIAREVRHHGAGRHARADRAARRRRPRLPAVDREAVPGPLLLRRQGLARGLRALQADPALRRHGPHHVDPLAERRRSSSSSA